MRVPLVSGQFVGRLVPVGLNRTRDDFTRGAVGDELYRTARRLAAGGHTPSDGFCRHGNEPGARVVLISNRFCIDIAVARGAGGRRDVSECVVLVSGRYVPDGRSLRLGVLDEERPGEQDERGKPPPAAPECARLRAKMESSSHCLWACHSPSHLRHVAVGAGEGMQAWPGPGIGYGMNTASDGPAGLELPSSKTNPFTIRPSPNGAGPNHFRHVVPSERQALLAPEPP